MEETTNSNVGFGASVSTLREVNPSAEDIEITKRVFAAGDLLGIRLLDHLIIAEDGRWFSFQEDGVLSTLPPWRSSL